MLTINSYDLPSKTEGKIINIEPATLHDIMLYNSYKAPTYVRSLIRDLDLLVSKIPEYKDYPLVDLMMLLLVKKMTSISGDDSFNVKSECAFCGSLETRSFSIKDSVDVTPSNLKGGEYAFINKIKHKIESPTIGDLESFLPLLDQDTTEYSWLEIKTMMYLGAYLNGNVKSTVLNSTGDDARTILNLHYSIGGVVYFKANCKSCNEEVVVNGDSVTTDMFRDFVGYKRSN